MSARLNFSLPTPRAGGNPAALNLPALINTNCNTRCDFNRTVTDLAGGGSWTGEFRGDPGMTVRMTPSTFSLGAGQSLPLQFEAVLLDPQNRGNRVEGEMVLTPADSSRG